MIPYYFMIAAPFLFYIVQFESQARQMITKKKNWPILIFFGVYLVLLACRHRTIGVDTETYLSLYERISLTDWANIFNIRDSEHGYTILNRVCSELHMSPQLFLTLAAIIIVVPLAVLYFKESENSLNSIALFLVFPVFMMNFSGLRQGIAISIGAIAYFAIKNKKPIWFVLLVLLASTFHQSALILLILYPLFHMRLRDVHLFALIPIYVIVYLFNDRIYQLVLPLLGEKYAERYEEISETGAITMIILMALFLAYSFLVPDKDAMDKTTVGLRNILVLCMTLQLFAPISSVAMRLNYYFVIYIPLLIPRITNRWKNVEPVIIKIVHIVMAVFFFGYYLIKAHNVDTLHLYPYIPFWV